MIKGIIHRLLLRRHFWRYASFDEVAELYASRLLRVSALRFAAVFTSVYLYKLGYSLAFLGLFWAAFYGLKVVFSWPSAKVAAYFGPKHGTLYSNIMAAISMLALLFAPTYGIWAMLIWAFFQSLSTCLYDVCYMVDFSKVKHVEHAGKEIGYMTIIEKLATNVSPIVGGFIASWFGPAWMIFFSAALFMVSAIPLFKTAEPTLLKQKLHYRGLPWRSLWRSLLAETGVGVDLYASGSAWMLFIAVVVLPGNDNSIYAKIGVFSALTIAVALLASYVFGRLTDRNEGGALLKVSVLANSAVHLIRSSVMNPLGIIMVNAANDAASTGYSIAFTKGMFDMADRAGARCTYLMCIEIALNIGAALASLIFAFFMSRMSATDIAFNAFFVAVAGLVLLIGVPKFPLYRK